jgi:hypothetical protein
MYWAIFSLGFSLKIKEDALIFGRFFTRKEVKYALQKGWGQTWGDFFADASGHSASWSVWKKTF